MLKDALRRRDNESHRGKPLRVVLRDGPSHAGKATNRASAVCKPRVGGRREPLLDIRLAYITGPGRRRDTSLRALTVTSRSSTARQPSTESCPPADRPKKNVGRSR
jgi:hypothetical protein